MQNHAIDGYVDIHAHVLPGIDDGPPDLGGALELARAAAAAGTELIVSTPHLRWDFPDVHVHELATRCRSLSEAIKREQIPIRLLCGGEASLTWALEASDEELMLVSYGQRATDLLIETPTETVLGMDWSLDSLQAKGYRITLAHPERSPAFQRDQQVLQELVDHGILLQINASSLLGAAQRRPHGRLARSLCENGLAHALASDGHRASDWRPVTHLAEAVSVAAELVGPERAQWMTRTAPSSIAEGAALPEAPAVVARRRPRGLFGRRQ